MSKKAKQSSSCISDIMYVNKRSVSCDGGDAGLGHPKIYLTIAPNDEQIACPYCSRVFLFRQKTPK